MITARTAVNDAETGPYLKTLAMIDSAIGQPRLSIAHLLGWTACTAIVLALGQVDRRVPPQQLGLWFFVGDLPDAMAYGAAMESLFIMVSRRWRGLLFPTEPGEWILVSLALYRLAGHLWDFAMRRFAPQIPFEWYLIGIAVVCGVPFLMALLFSKAPIHWRIVFGVLAISVFAPIAPAVLWLLTAPFHDFGTALAQWIPLVRPISWIAAGSFAIGVDRMRHRRHGWLHNVGAVVLLVPPSVALLNQFAPSNWFD